MVADARNLRKDIYDLLKILTRFSAASQNAAVSTPASVIGTSSKDCDKHWFDKGNVCRRYGKGASKSGDLDPYTGGNRQTLGESMGRSRG